MRDQAIVLSYYPSYIFLDADYFRTLYCHARLLNKNLNFLFDFNIKNIVIKIQSVEKYIISINFYN